MLEIDLEKLAQEAIDKEDENIAFQVYLNEQDSDAVDVVVAKLNAEITPAISCVECGNCCVNLRPIASREEVGQFVHAEDIDKYMYADHFACVHQVDKKCTKYLERSQECRDFPYMDRDKYTSRTYGVLLNYPNCPIVYNIFEQLKVELEWSFK